MALSSNPLTVKLSPSEAKSKALNQKNLEIAVRALARDGLVVVEDLVPHSVLDTLNEKMIQDAYKLQSMENSPYNFNKGNLQQDPLMTKDFFFQDVFVNPIVTQISSTVLGPNPSLRFISGNTAFPPTASVPPQSQPTHNDADFDHPAIPFALVINVPLVTMTPENGSTEIWLGTHANTTINDQEGAHGDRASGRIKQHLLEQQRSVRPPSQPIIKKGSVVIRDLRLWHGGKPNLSQEPRVMLAFIHFAPWYRNQMIVEVAKELKDELSVEKTKLHVAAKFLDSEEVEKTYLNRPYGNAYDFDQIEKIEGLF